MASYESTFGETPCLMTVSAHVDLPSQSLYIACLYVIEDDGHALRAVGDTKGDPIQLPAATEADALMKARAHLAKRFGAEGPAARWTTPIRQRHENQPPLKDRRPPVRIVRAIANIKKRQTVFIDSRGDASVVPPLTRTGPTLVGQAVEDIRAGHKGSVREYVTKPPLPTVSVDGQRLAVGPNEAVLHQGPWQDNDSIFIASLVVEWVDKNRGAPQGELRMEWEDALTTPTDEHEVQDRLMKKLANRATFENPFTFQIIW